MELIKNSRYEVVITMNIQKSALTVISISEI